MFRFENPNYLVYLFFVLVVIAILIYHNWQRNRRIASLGSAPLIDKLQPNWSQSRYVIKAVLIVFAFLFLILSLANPQWGQKKQKVQAQSSDIYIALDISQSMMANDVSPNRLERAKRTAQKIIQSLNGNRVGVILFAGNAYLQMPLSHDISAAQLFISSANTNQAGTQGTAIAEVIDLVQRVFDEKGPQQKALILITDGESHDDEATNKVQEANANGLYTFTIGVGTEQGSFIPYQTNRGVAYKRDDAGAMVKSKLNRHLITELAEVGGGKSYFIQSANDLIDDLLIQLNQIEKYDVEQKSFTDHESYFQYFLLIGLLFFIIEYFVPMGKRKVNRVF